MEESTGLAGLLNKIREIVEAAETPFAKLAVFILPILAPAVPASLTGLHIYKLLLLIFESSWGSWVDTVSRTMAVVVALVLEMLGYVGAITFIHSLFDWILNKEEEGYALPVLLNGAAYFFYLIAMFLINYQLGIYFNTPGIVNIIVGLLSFITVPTGLLAANNLSQKEQNALAERRHQERRTDNLERYKIKHGANEQPNVRPQKRTKAPNESRSVNVRSYVANVRANEHRTPGPSEIARAVNVSKSYAHEVLQAILQEGE